MAVRAIVVEIGDRIIAGGTTRHNPTEVGSMATRSMTFRAPLLMAAPLAVAICIAGCTSKSSTSLGPVPTGVTVIGRNSVSNVPTPAAPKIPASQQEAQDAVIGYLQKTVNGLPPGTALDSTDFRGGANMACVDEHTDPGKPPTRFEYWTHVNGPQGSNPDDLVSKTGDVWKSLDINVIERDDFRKPNRFGYASDGYELQIKGAAKPGYPPTLIVLSPCFPGDLERDDIAWPSVVAQPPAGGR